MEYPTRERGMIIALHGHGDDPATALGWAQRLAPRGWQVVAPAAPEGQDGTRSWFTSGPRGVDGGDLSRAVGMVDQALQASGAARRVVVIGFSQGAAVALEVAARRDDITAVVALSGFMADGDGIEDSRIYSPKVRVLMLAGTADDHVPAFMSADASALLRSHGMSVDDELLEMGHEVSDKAVDAVSLWLDRLGPSSQRISLALPIDRVAAGADLVSGAAIMELAEAYERFGFHAAYVTDHPAPDDRWLAHGGHHALEPTVALAVAASVTSRLLLHTNVYVLAYRNPFLAAKTLATLDVVSDGRLILGVAAGYLRPEFEALGVPFDDRGERLDEVLALLPRIWAEEGVAAQGAGYSAGSVTALPRPVQTPHPPIWVGGNSLAAMRRAVHFGQGWSPFPTPAGMERAVRTAAIANAGDLQSRLTRLQQMCDEAGRSEPITTCFVPFSLPAYLADPRARRAQLRDEVGDLREMGVDWVALAVPGESRREVLEEAEALAAELRLNC